MDKLHRMEELIIQIEKHNYAYYTLDNPLISDKEYDDLYYELVNLERELGVVLDNSPTQKVGDVALIDKVCQYDFDLSEIDDVNVGYMQDFDLTYFETSYKKYKGNSFVISTLASADRFSTKKETLDTLIQLGANVSDMEAGAIAQVAYSNDIDFYILKLLTDVEGGSAESIFTQYINNIISLFSN